MSHGTTRRSLSAVYVGNIPNDATEEDIAEIFMQIGHVSSVKIKRESSGKSKGFCFVEYNDVNLANLAVQKLTNVQMGGRTLRVGSNMNIGMHSTDKGTPQLIQKVKQIQAEQNPVVPDQHLIGGMSVKELYGIMSEMKKIVQQNPEQARKILVEQSGLTRSLFHAQVRLGMIKPSQADPSNMAQQSNMHHVEKMRQPDLSHTPNPQQQQQQHMFPQQQVPNPQQFKQQQIQQQQPQQQQFQQQQFQQQQQQQLQQQQQFPGFLPQQGNYHPRSTPSMSMNQPLTVDGSSQGFGHSDPQWNFRGEEGNHAHGFSGAMQEPHRLSQVGGADMPGRAENSLLQSESFQKQENIDAVQQNALLQQVLQMTPDMIDRLRPEQKAQVEKLRVLAQSQSMGY